MPSGWRMVVTSFMFERGLAGVVLAGLEAFARIGHVAGAPPPPRPPPRPAAGGRGGRLRRRNLLGRARLRNRNLSYGRAASLLRRCGAGTLWRWRRILCEDRGHGQKKSSTDSDAVNVSARVHFHSTGLPKSPYMRTISAR
jgi:hypothetical protein